MTIKFKKTKSVTRAFIKWEDGVERYIKFDGAVYTGKDVPGSKMDAPQLAHVIDLESGEESEIIVPAVLESVLDEQYPDDSYVGKSFAIKPTKPTEAQIEAGKRYTTFAIAEIEVE